MGDIILAINSFRFKSILVVCTLIIMTAHCGTVGASNLTMDSIILEEVIAPYEFIAVVGNVSIDAPDAHFNLSSKSFPSILYYDWDEGEGAETLNFTVDNDKRQINKPNLFYKTVKYQKTIEPEFYIAWLGEPYFVIESSGDWYISELLVDESEDDDHLIGDGESLTLPKGFAITVTEIDVDGEKARFEVTQDDNEVYFAVVNVSEEFRYETDLNDSGVNDNWVLKFNTEAVFAVQNTKLVKINALKLIDPNVLKIETPDDDTIPDFTIESPDDHTLIIELDESDDTIDLLKNGIVSFLNDRFSFRINEDGNIGAVVKVVEEPGKYEFFTMVTDISPIVPDANFRLSSQENPSILYYDLDSGEGAEILNFTVDNDQEEINKSNFEYRTETYQIVDREGDWIAWLCEPYYVAESGGDWYITPLLMDDNDTYQLSVGESLSLPDGFAIILYGIDIDGKKAWFIVTEEGGVVKSSVVKVEEEFRYETDLNESGHDDNWVLTFNVEYVDPDIVKINGIKLLDPEVFKIETPDDDTIPDFTIKSIDDHALIIELDESDDTIDLLRDGIVSFLDRFNIGINEDGDSAAVVKIVEVNTPQSVTINNDDVYTNSTTVQLTLSADDAAEMNFSNDGISWSSWEPFKTTKSWSLTGGDGVKTVHFTTRNNSIEAWPVEDTIVLDTTKPVVTNLSLSTFTPSINEHVDITADIRDNYLLHPFSTIVSVEYPTGRIKTFPMWGIETFYCKFNDTSEYGRYNVTIVANDFAGNSNNTETTWFVTSTPPYTNESINTTTDHATTIDALEEVNTTLELVTSAVITDGVVQITMSNEIPHGLNQTFGVNALGKYISIISDDLENNISWMIIKIYYTQAELEVSRLDESSLVLRYYNETSYSWEPITPSGVNPTEVDIYSGYVWANVSHLSYYAVGGELQKEIPPSGNGGKGGGGGSGASSGEDFANILISETERKYVNKDSKICYSFDSEGNIVRYINFTALTSAGRIAAKVEILKNTSTMVDHAPLGIVYKNLNIGVGNQGWATSRNIAYPTINFKVEKSWVSENNIDDSTIKMYRYSNGKWNQLDTSRIGEKADYLYFEAETTGFSPFVVTGKKIGETKEIDIEPTAAVEETPGPTPTEKKRGIPGFSLFAGISILLITMQILRIKK